MRSLDDLLDMSKSSDERHAAFLLAQITAHMRQLQDLDPQKLDNYLRACGYVKRELKGEEQWQR